MNGDLHITKGGNGDRVKVEFGGNILPLLHAATQLVQHTRDYMRMKKENLERETSAKVHRDEAMKEMAKTWEGPADLREK